MFWSAGSFCHRFCHVLWAIGTGVAFHHSLLASCGSLQWFPSANKEGSVIGARGALLWFLDLQLCRPLIVFSYGGYITHSSGRASSALILSGSECVLYLQQQGFWFWFGLVFFMYIYFGQGEIRWQLAGVGSSFYRMWPVWTPCTIKFWVISSVLFGIVVWFFCICLFSSLIFIYVCGGVPSEGGIRSPGTGVTDSL